MTANLDKHLPDRLQRRLAAPLSGAHVRAQWAPQLCYGRHDGPPAWNARPAAILVLLNWDATAWRIPLTRRPETMSHHSGQISFPGGVVEEGETYEEAAVRELHEELGVVPPDLRMLGRLSSIYVFASNFVVVPCLATTFSNPQFVPNPHEVANLLQPTLVELLNPDRHIFGTIERRGVVFDTPQIRVDEHLIWGATCMVLGELLALLDGIQ